MAGGQYAVYRVVTWLDSDAPNDTQNAAVTFTLHFIVMQQAAFDAAGFPPASTTPKAEVWLTFRLDFGALQPDGCTA